MSEQDATLDKFSDEDTSEPNGGWKSVKLEDVAYKRSDNVDPNQVDLERHVGLEHIQPNTPTPDWEPVDGLSSTKRRFEAGDILFAKLRPNLEKSAQPGFEGISSTDIFPIVATDDINSKYLLYRLSSKPAYDHARRTSVGTRMPRTSWNLFSNYEFHLPPLEEQRNIATVLDIIDQAIEKTNSIRKQLLRVRKGVFQSVFTQGIGDTETKSVRLLSIDTEAPEHWEVVSVENVSTLVTDGAHLTPEKSESGYYLLGARNVQNGYVDLDDPDYVSEKEYRSLIEKCNPQPDDILMSCRGVGLGRVAVVPDGLECALLCSAALIKVEDSVHSEYAEKVLRHIDVQKQIKALQTQSAQPNLFQKEIASLEFPLPPIEEQKEIARLLSGYDEQIKFEEAYKNQLERLKQGLMQDLLSGEVRTHDKNIEIVDDVLQYG
jgi:type I restriction enzyme S subunit